MPTTYPVGQAPWETASTTQGANSTASTPPPANSFPVGQAPWEKPQAAQPAPAKASIFGNPAQDIQDAGADVHAAITGTGQYQGQSPLSRGVAAASSAALAIPNVVADVIPGAKTVLNLATGAANAGINIAANIPNTLADLAQKVGVMTPEQRAQYDKNNSEFANSPTGVALQAVARGGNNLGNIANVVLMADGAARSTQDFLDNKLPAAKAAVQNAVENANTPSPDTISPDAARQAELVQKTSDEIKSLEDRYAKTRNANDYSPDGGTASRQRIAQSGVLKYTVDENGVLRTKDPGGAVDQYRMMTVAPAEDVVRNALAQEGSKVLLTDIESALVQRVQDSGLKGGDLISALNGVKREVAGLRLDADTKGYVPTTALQDAKINTTSNINFNTPPEVAKYRKALASGYKTIIEDNSAFNVKEVNTELAKFYSDISRLEALDGARVSGGKLGRYTAQLAGHIVGGMAGMAFGPFSAVAGSMLGGEAAAALKGKIMANTFNKGAESAVPDSPVLEKAIQDTKVP